MNRAEGAASPPRVPDCPLARTVVRIGDWWTLEILHELFNGNVGFDGIRTNLQLPAPTLARRLTQLAERGLLEADPDSGADSSYRLTRTGRSLRPLLLVMAAYGNSELAPEQRSLIVVDAVSGQQVEPVVVDAVTGRRIDGADHKFAVGPAASNAMRAQYPPTFVSITQSDRR
ncbi:helix-turn-helix domain-containing protein [Nocardia sp. NPDC005998]|uniref:winged helix-turn-helix transcriptional regulator n=1 Tax=Nocardia sp. NPDC005998 TaxID=3156894 RepID=UPI0033B849F6